VQFYNDFNGFADRPIWYVNIIQLKEYIWFWKQIADYTEEDEKMTTDNWRFSKGEWQWSIRYTRTVYITVSIVSGILYTRNVSGDALLPSLDDCYYTDKYFIILL
jgi:hypothetical protein